jgi:hypothetical protein
VLDRRDNSGSTYASTGLSGDYAECVDDGGLGQVNSEELSCESGSVSKGKSDPSLAMGVGIGMIACIGVAIVLYATSIAIGTDVDAATYLMAARDLLMGKGVTLQDPQSSRFVPMTGFPPLLPIALAMLGYLGAELMSAARWLNAILFGVNIFLVAHIVKRCTGSLTASLCAALIALTTVDVLSTHATLLSEPLFLAAGLSGLILTMDYVKEPSVLKLCLLSAAFGAAAAARYAGVCWLPVGLAAIGLARAERRQRTVHLAVYLAIFGAPLTVWVTRNFVFVHALTNRVFVFHPPSAIRLMYSLVSLSSWLLPALVPLSLRLLALAALLLWLIWPVVQYGSAAASRSEMAVFRRIAAVFLLSYFSIFVISQTFFDAQIWLAGRHLLPIYLVGTILAVCRGYEVLQRGSRWRKYAIISACLGIIFIGGTRTGKWAEKSHRDGIGLTSRRWRDSELIGRIRNLDSSVPVVSNSTALIYLLTDRVTYGFPTPMNAETNRPKPEYNQEIAQVADRVEREGAVVVLFTAFAPQQTYRIEKEMENHWGLQQLAAGKDGYLLGKSTGSQAFVKHLQSER